MFSSSIPFTSSHCISISSIYIKSHSSDLPSLQILQQPTRERSLHLPPLSSSATTIILLLVPLILPNLSIALPLSILHPHVYPVDLIPGLTFQPPLTPAPGAGIYRILSPTTTNFPARVSVFLRASAGESRRRRKIRGRRARRKKGKVSAG